MSKKKKNDKYCPICGVIEGAEPFGVPCTLDNCPRNKKRKKR